MIADDAKHKIKKINKGSQRILGVPRSHIKRVCILPGLIDDASYDKKFSCGDVQIILEFSNSTKGVFLYTAGGLLRTQNSRRIFVAVRVGGHCGRECCQAMVGQKMRTKFYCGIRLNILGVPTSPIQNCLYLAGR